MKKEVFNKFSTTSTKFAVLNKIIIAFILVMIVFTGFLLRIYKVGTYPLWSDEAETVINSRQVLSGQLPNGYYKGEPSFENFIEIPAPASETKYAYIDRNYLGAKYENNKGWLTYYFLAGWQRLVGFSTVNVRLLFILISTFSIFLLFLIAKTLYGRTIGLFSVFIYAINPALIEYGRMCRYYSLMVLFVLLSLYFYIKLSQNKRKLYYYLLSGSLILLFHTHIVSFFAVAIFLLIHWFFVKKEKLDKHQFINFIIFFIITIPWLILVKFWVNIADQNSLQWKLVWLLCCFLIVFLIYYIQKILNLLRGENKKIKWQNLCFLEIFVLIYTFFSTLLIPSESLHHRSLLPVFVLFNILLIVYFKKIFLEKRINYLVIFVILSTISVYLIWVVKVDYQSLYRPYWVWQIKDYLDKEDVSENTPIYLRNYYQSLSVYIPNKVILIDVLRQKFLDETKEEFYFFIKRNDFCALADQSKCVVEGSSYHNIIKICPFKQINDDIGAYHCNAQSLN